MAHFARICDGVVVQVIAVANEAIGGGDFPGSEPAGQAFIAALGLEGDWKQTSYSGSFRGKFAGIGDTYDPISADAFVQGPPGQG